MLFGRNLTPGTMGKLYRPEVLPRKGIVMRGCFISALTIVLLSTAVAAAQKVQAVQEKPLNIYIGQSLDEVVQVLRQRKLEFHEGGLEISAPDPDQSSLTFTLDHNHAYAHVFFSKSKRVTSGIWLDFFPARTAQWKSSRSTVTALDIVLYPDSTYSVRFAKPLTLEQLLQAEANRPQSVYPSNTIPGNPTAPRK